MALDERSVFYEGSVAGIIGATAVAVWFAIGDFLHAQAFFTPQILGDTLFGIFGARQGGPLNIVGYTIFHYAVFILIGVVATVIARFSRRVPSVLAGFLILFVILELGFQAVIIILSEWTPLGALAWPQVLGANLVAALLMGFYLWRKNPGLAGRLDMALKGVED